MRPSSRSAWRRSGASACAIPTFSVGPSQLPDSNPCSNSRNALCAPRTRLSGTTSPSSIPRIGLMFSSVPAIAAALPMRPPLARYSRVSTVQITRLSRRNRSTRASSSSSVVPARAAAGPRARASRARRRRCPVDRAHTAVAELLGGAARALDRARQLRRHVQREDPRVAAELFVRAQEVRRRRLRRRRRDRLRRRSRS